MKKIAFLIATVLLISLITIAGCAQPTAPGSTETTKTVTATTTTTATVTAPAKTVTVTAGAEKPGVIKWTMSGQMADSPAMSYYKNPGATHTWMLHSLVDRGLADWARYITSGRLDITVVEPGAIYPIGESVENIGQGVIEIAHVAQGWLTGSVVETNVAMGLPMAWDNPQLAFDAYHNFGINAIMDEVYAERNCWAEFVPTDEIMGFFTNFPLPHPDSIKGKKLRVWGAYGKLVEVMGGLPVAMAYADIYMGMKLGTVDGAATAALALENIKLKEVVTDITATPRLNNPVNVVLINMDAFKALPEDIQHILNVGIRDYAMAIGGPERQQNQLAVAGAQKDYGLKVWNWSADETLMLRGLAKEQVWPYYGAMSARNQEILDLLTEHMQILGLLE